MSSSAASVEIENKSNYGALVLGFFIVTWLSWYMWTFRMSPALHPREPKQMPYLIPVIGHAISFFKDSESVFTKSRIYFNDTRKPCAVTVAGQKLYIVTSSRDVSTIYKNTTTLSFDSFVRDMMFSMGASKDGVQKMWGSPRYDSQYPDRLHKILAHAGEDYYRQQFHEGTQLDILWARIQDLINSSLVWDGIMRKCVISEATDTKTLSLLKWCGENLLCSATTAVFGPKLLQLQPDLMDFFLRFDDEGWKLTYNMPRSLCRGMYAAREKITATFERYFALPREERTGETWVVRVLESEMRKIELKEHDIAALFVLPFWVINGNAFKLCFWIMAYLLYDPDLYAAVRAEVDHAVSPGLTGLETRIEKCPRLVAVYNELLRYITASASARTVDAPTDLGDLTLSPGAKVLIPYRQLHFDEAIFGPNAAQFDAQRFLANKELAKNPAFRPFGGGTTYCAGRHIAKREVLAFVALALHRFDIDVVGGITGKTQQAFPKCDLTKPSLGILPPLAGEDLQVTVKIRASDASKNQGDCSR